MSLHRANLPNLVVVSATATVSTSNILSGMFDDAVGITIFAPTDIGHVYQIQVNRDTDVATASSGWATALSGGQTILISAGQAVAYLSGNVGSLRVSSQGVEATTNGSVTRIFGINKQFQVS